MTMFVVESSRNHSYPECWIAKDEKELINMLRDGHNPFIPLDATLEEAEYAYSQNCQDLRIFHNATEAAKAWSTGWESEQIEDQVSALLDQLIRFAWEITDLALRFEIVGAAWTESRSRERKVAEAAQEAIRAGIAAGLSEVRIAELLNVNRLTVRRALGK